jgi:hypothetical protein
MTKIHPLQSDKHKAGRITFVHFDGVTRTFNSVVNRLSGDRLSWFDNDAPSSDPRGAWARSVVQGIKKKAPKVIAIDGSF